MKLEDVISIARKADTMARYIGCRFVPDPQELRILGLSDDEIAVVLSALGINLFLAEVQ